MKHIHTHARRGAAFVLTISLTLIALPWGVTVEAAVNDWQRGMSTVPETQTDFDSEDFRQSLRDLAATGVNSVGLVVPYYQSDLQSHDVQAGGNTPTDAALRAAINYAHSLGLAVMLKPHIESYTGHWRAEINPNNREAWFGAYGDKVVHLAEVAEDTGTEYLLIGTELVSLTAETIHPDNTSHWYDLIDRVRAVYSGQVSYNANSTNYNPGNNDPFQDEKRFIGFWDAVDVIGLSVYYNLDAPTDSVSDIRAAWDRRNQNDLQPFHQQYPNKPIVFTEIGYRSIDGARYNPWDWERNGSPDQQEQANLYEALITYWNDYNWMQGVYWWDWEPYPWAGEDGTTSYTPQNKQAETVMTDYFTGATQPDPDPDPDPSPDLSFSSSVSTPSNATADSPVTFSANVTASGGSFTGIVDVEVYNQAGSQVFQQFYENETFSNGQQRNFTAQWTPSSNGTYRVAVGVFRSNWSENLHWNNDAGQVAVGTSQPDPDPDPEPPPSIGNINVWWPTNGASVSGVQPFKAMVEGLDISEYQMYWQVGSGRMNDMYDSDQDYPHKEALVDLSGWNWNGSGPYTITFTAQQGGSTIDSQSVDITISQ